MSVTPYLPVFELTRGEVVESIHDGAVAVMDVQGNLLAWYGNPETTTYLRSAAKPFQALPFIENGGHTRFGLTHREIALLCASHSGTDEHVSVLAGLQAKTGVREADLMCGTHPPYHEPTATALLRRGEEPTPNRHNCSGKHTGMVAALRLRSWAEGGSEAPLTYIDPDLPLQREIRRTFAAMCCLDEKQVHLGIDGCSAPNFAAPLRRAAWAFARLADPEQPGEAGCVPISPQRASACRLITAAMMAHPDMVGGPGRFDTALMELMGGRLVSKAGAEGFQAIGVLPGALGPGSPALGIAMKVGDGDLRARIRPALAVEVLRQLGVLSAEELQALAGFGPAFPIHNWRKVLVGEGRPCFELQRRAAAEA